MVNTGASNATSKGGPANGLGLNSSSTATAKSIMNQGINFLSAGASEGGGRVDLEGQAQLAQKCREAASSALEESFAGAYGSLGGGQITILEGYVKPAMQGGIESDPVDFTADDLSGAGLGSHYAAEVALSDTIDAAATAAEVARDAVKNDAESDSDGDGDGDADE